MNSSDADDSAPPLPSLRWSGCTHVGRVRKNNEDAFLALTFDRESTRYLGKTGEASLDQGDFVFAVSDGMGGANAGEFASRIAVDKITELLPRTFRLSAMGLSQGPHELLEEIFSRTHEAMESMGFHYEECRGMGATLSLCWFTPEQMVFAHIGDSRIYYLPREGGIRQITKDHTHVDWLLETGRITKTEARFHPKRHVLNKALGARFNHVEPQLGTVKYESGDRILLCTDGVLEASGPAGLEVFLRQPSKREAESPPAQRIVDDAVRISGKDNSTAVVVEVL
ncbi:MAG: serine/threonine-protein phosphatase [Opitutales bacterium]|nr:serine/threonine-protein phosphatase [Opitutales bacterium]